MGLSAAMAKIDTEMELCTYCILLIRSMQFVVSFICHEFSFFHPKHPLSRYIKLSQKLTCPMI